MEKLRVIKENRTVITIIITMTLLMSLITLGISKGEKYIYQYNYNKVKTSNRISDRIEYSIKAIQHSRTKEEVRDVMELIRNSKESVANNY